MIGAITGSIVGVRFEGFAAPEPDFALLHPHCHFTDDTVRTLAVAEAILKQADRATMLSLSSAANLDTDMRQVSSATLSA